MFLGRAAFCLSVAGLRVLLSGLLLTIATIPGRGQNISFDILHGEGRIEVPFQLSQNFILVDVVVDGTLPLKFIFDTGAENTILFDKELGDVLNFEYNLRIPVFGADLSAPLFALVTRSVMMEVGTIPPNPVDMLVLEETYFDISEITGIPVHGLIGGNFFRNSVVQIDYRRHKIIIYSDNYFKAPGRQYQEQQIAIEANKPYIHTTATLMDGTQLELKLLLDTGAGIPLMLHNNTHPNLSLPETTIVGQLGIGLGGFVMGYIGRIASLNLVDTELENIITSFQDLEAGFDLDSVRNRNGLVGNQMLARFDVIIDYVNSTLFLKPTSRIKDKFEMDRSGLIIFAHGSDLREYVVQGIIDGSPADEAGLQIGDILIRIQGFPATFFTLNQITRKLQKREGKRIRLVVRRGEEQLKFAFELRDLI